MVRLTPELVARSPQIVNCCGDRELDLRGNQIPIVENLATCRDQFDVIDLTNNTISLLSGFPLLSRVKTLLIGKNRITSVGPGFAKSLPSLESLVLVSNQISSLMALDELTGLRKLERLTLIDNPVVSEAHYRLYLIEKIPSLRLLDHRKVKLHERQEAKKLFSGAEGKRLMKKLESHRGAASGTNIAQNGGGDAAVTSKQPTKEQIDAVKKAIQEAKSIDEITRLEKMLLVK